MREEIGFKDSELFESFSKFTKSSIYKNREIALKVLKKFKVSLVDCNESIELLSDGYDAWCSYVISVPCQPEKTVALNECYAEHFVQTSFEINKFYYDVIFNFESKSD